MVQDFLQTYIRVPKSYYIKYLHSLIVGLERGSLNYLETLISVLICYGKVYRIKFDKVNNKDLNFYRVLSFNSMHLHSEN